MKYTDIIWDFNGTILDDVEAGIISVNKLLSSRGLPTIPEHVLSATELSMLKNQLFELGIADRFSSVYGLDNIHASSKTELAKRWREENPDAVALFIGDTEHDFVTAKTIGCDCALVCGGHQSKEKLIGCAGAFVFEDVYALLSSLDENASFGS